MKHVVICQYAGLEYTVYQGLQFKCPSKSDSVTNMLVALLTDLD